MIIVDNFLSDGELKDELTAESNWNSSLGYSWSDKHSEATNAWSIFCRAIWNEFYIPKHDYAGFEYWTNLSYPSTEDSLPWHYDHDEHLYNTTGTIVTPNLGLVYYCHKELPEGGYLEIDRGNNQLERIQPVPNRLIIFDPSIKHHVTPLSGGVRKTLACNVWIDKPMSENFA